jgi:hypothetical protein
MHIGNYIELVHKSEKDLSEAFITVGKHHSAEPDILNTCKLLASWSEELITLIAPFIKKYGEEKNKEPDRLMSALFKGPRKGGLSLLRDLHDLWLMTNEAELCSILLRQAASGLRDKELIEVCDFIETQSKRQTAWLLTRMKSTTPQTLIAAS